MQLQLRHSWMAHEAGFDEALFEGFARPVDADGRVAGRDGVLGSECGQRAFVEVNLLQDGGVLGWERG